MNTEKEKKILRENLEKMGEELSHLKPEASASEESKTKGIAVDTAICYCCGASVLLRKDDPNGICPDCGSATITLLFSGKAIPSGNMVV